MWSMKNENENKRIESSNMSELFIIKFPFHAVLAALAIFMHFCALLGLR